MQRPLKLASGIGQAEMDAILKKFPAPVMNWKPYFPTIQVFGDSWKTLTNQSSAVNVAADSVALGSSAPIKSRQGVETISGGFGVFKTGRIKDEREIEYYLQLQNKSSQFTSPDQWNQILNWILDDVQFVRTAALAQANYLSWALLSSACNLGIVAGNSPYLAGLKNLSYPIAAWQKNNVATSWDNAASLIIDDIESVVETAKTYGKILTKIKINRTWFKHVQNNTQVQKLCATYIQNALNLQGVPTIAVVNNMLQTYFDNSMLQFEVIDELVSREDFDGSIVTSNPFADGVAVFTTTSRVGSFQYSMLTSVPGTITSAEDFYRIERLYQSDPDLEKTLVKFQGMPVIDTYADNFYLKVNAVAW